MVERLAGDAVGLAEITEALLLDEVIHAISESREGESLMPKRPARHNKSWTPREVQKLEQLAAGNTPTRVIGLKLDRTEDAVRSKASEEEISLKPTNQSPYNRRKKS